MLYPTELQAHAYFSMTCAVRGMGLFPTFSLPPAYDRWKGEIINSEHSMKSQWVEFEIRKARKQEVQKKKRVLFPIRLVSYKAIKEWECFDADTKKDLATEIREYYIPDFSDWKNPAAYKKEFDRLLRDLKADDEKASMSK